MKVLRPMEVVTCCVCGEEFDKIKMHKIFTGRTKYICPECYSNANRQMDARRSDWKGSTRGKQIISESEKKRRK